MKFHFSQKMIRNVSVILPLLFLSASENLFAEQLKTGGNAPVTQQIRSNAPFQPVLKGPTQAEANLLKAEYLFLQGKILEAKKWERQALQCYERACQYVSSDAILVCLVSLAIQQKRYDEALSYFDKISAPELLGLAMLDELSSCCVRLEETSRIVKIYRALLKTIPQTEIGPLRLLIHDRLAWAEYQEDNFEEAKVSLEILHALHKNPRRFGIGEEEFKLFKDKEELTLYLLFDIAVMEKDAPKAANILEDLRNLYARQTRELLEQQKNAEKTEISRKSENGKLQDALQKMEEQQKELLLASARLAYVQEDLDKAFSLAMQAYEAGVVDEGEPFALLDSILKTQNREAEAFEILKKLAQKHPSKPAFQKRLAKEYLRLAKSAPNEKEKIAAEEQAFSLLRKLLPENELKLRIQLIGLAVEQGKPELFLEEVLNFARLNPNCGMEDLLEVLPTVMPEISPDVWETAEAKSAENSNIAENSEPKDSEKSRKDTDSKESSENSKEETAADASQTDSADKEEKILASKQFEEFWNLLFQYADGKLPSEELKKNENIQFEEEDGEETEEAQSWQKAWLLTILAHEIGRTEEALKHYAELLQMLKNRKFTENEQVSLNLCFNETGFFLIHLADEFSSGEKADPKAEEKFEKAAEEHFRLAMEKLPKEFRHAIVHTHLLLSLNRLKEARSQIRKLQESDPMNLEFILLEAKLLLKEKKPWDAQALLKSILAELEADFSAEFNRTALNPIRQLLASVEEQLENLPMAEEQIRCILDEFPDDANAKNSLAYLWACAGQNLEQALQFSLDSLEAEPGNSMYMDTLGWIYFQLGQFEKALEILTSVSEEMDDPVVFSHLGDVCLALDQKEKAIQYFKQSLQHFDEAQRKNDSWFPKDREHVEAQLKMLNQKF